MSLRPYLVVLAGVNGAGKSSVGGQLLERHGLEWFNPDDYARQWLTETGCDLATANGVAWTEGLRRLDEALAEKRDHAFETTLGGRTIAQRIRSATQSHDVVMWFCGLESPEHHIARVKQRVAQGGHDIPESKIRERYNAARANLIHLMPHLAQLRVYDNSTDAALGEPVPDPILVLETEGTRVLWPTDSENLQNTPDWAKPLVEAALSMTTG